MLSRNLGRATPRGGGPAQFGLGPRPVGPSQQGGKGDHALDATTRGPSVSDRWALRSLSPPWGLLPLPQGMGKQEGKSPGPDIPLADGEQGGPCHRAHQTCYDPTCSG